MCKLTNRIERTFHGAQANQIARGLAWFPTAADLAGAIVEPSPFEPEQGMGAIAALSPRMFWHANLRAAGELVTAAALGEPAPNVGIRRNVRKAERILAGEMPLDVLGGPKVRAFYAAIAGDTESVTVDVWASRVAGVDIPKNEKAYARIAAAYHRAAARCDLAPRELQAVTWIVEREQARHPNQLILPIAV